MINYGIVHGSTAPQAIEFTKDKVFVASNIEAYEEEIEGRTISGYRYNYNSYSRDEYILL